MWNSKEFPKDPYRGSSWQDETWTAWSRYFRHKIPKLEKKQRARKTKRALKLSQVVLNELRMDRKANLTDRETTVIENGKQLPKVGVRDGNKRVLPWPTIGRKKGGTKGQKLGAMPLWLVKEPIGRHGFWENRKASRQIPLRTNSCKWTSAN